MPHSFVPDDFILTDKLKDFARDKGYTDKHLEEQEEIWRDWQFKIVIKCWDRSWRNWVRKSIEYGKVVPATVKVYNKPVELSDDQKAADVKKWQDDMKRFKVVK